MDHKIGIKGIEGEIMTHCCSLTPSKHSDEPVTKADASQSDEDKCCYG